MFLLTLGAHAQRGLQYLGLSVCLCVCLSVKSHLTYGASVRPENAVTYSAGNEGQKIRGDLPETTAFKSYAAKHERKSQYANFPTYRCQLSPLDTQRRARGYPTIVNNIQPCPKLCILMPLARVGARTDSTTRYSYNARRGQLPRTRVGIVRRTRAKHAVCAEGLHFSAFHYVWNTFLRPEFGATRHAHNPICDEGTVPRCSE